MRLRSVFRVSQFRGGAPFVSYKPAVSSPLQSRPKRSSFGIAFDVDGVVLRGRAPIGGSSKALRRLYGDHGVLKVPFVFLTNGGGIPEYTRALELSQLLGVNILPAQFAFFMVLQGHSPFRNLLNRYENELIVATGKGNPALVMSEYGFKKVLSMDEYASYFDNIDPVSQYKAWTSDDLCLKDLGPKCDVFSERVQAAFVVSDPVDWGRDIQVLCDILRSGGLPGQTGGYQPPLYFAADDLQYQCRLLFRWNDLGWVPLELL